MYKKDKYYTKWQACLLANIYIFLFATNIIMLLAHLREINAQLQINSIS